MSKVLAAKYNRPDEIVGGILNKGTMMQFPGDSQKVSKSNCLTMLKVRRDLKKYAMESKLDSFYLSSIAGKCFNEVEYGRYIRESELDETAFQDDVRKAAALKRKTAIMNSTTVPGDTDKELSEAVKLRDLSDDESSDAETDKFSFVEHPKAVDHDPGSKRQRKHFFKFMEGVMSNQLHYSENQIKIVKRVKINMTYLQLSISIPTPKASLVSYQAVARFIRTPAESQQSHCNSVNTSARI